MTIEILETLASLKPGSACTGAGRRRSRILSSNAPAGVFVYENDTDRCDLPATAAAVTAGRGGVLRFDPAKRPNDNGLEFEDNEQVTYFKKGPITVLTEEAVSDGDPVYVRHTAKGGNTQLGAFRNDPDGTTAATLTLTNTLTTILAATHGLNLVIDNVPINVPGDDGTLDDTTEIADIIATAINATAEFVAENAGAVISVTRADGAHPGAVNLMLPNGITSTGDTCALLPGAKFVGDHSSGAAVVDFDLR